jgi:hypothetical protein
MEAKPNISCAGPPRVSNIAVEFGSGGGSPANNVFRCREKLETHTRSCLRRLWPIQRARGPRGSFCDNPATGERKIPLPYPCAVGPFGVAAGETGCALKRRYWASGACGRPMLAAMRQIELASFLADQSSSLTLQTRSPLVFCPINAPNHSPFLCGAG